MQIGLQEAENWPIDADGCEVEDGCGTAHDVTCNPGIAQQITESPVTAAYLKQHRLSADLCYPITLASTLIIQWWVKDKHHGLRNTSCTYNESKNISTLSCDNFDIHELIWWTLAEIIFPKTYPRKRPLVHYSFGDRTLILQCPSCRIQMVSVLHNPGTWHNNTYIV